MTTTKTTIWRPNGRVTLDEDGEVDDTERGGEEVTKKGTKRKGAPPTKGPCEHGVKYRSQCRCAALVRTGSGADSARSAVGLESASTVVSALVARSAVGAQSASTVVYAIDARSAVGLESASTVVSALRARSAVGLKSASTVVSAIAVRSAAGLESASTVVSALSARSAVGAQSASTAVSAVYARSAVGCLLYTSPSPRDRTRSRMPSSA